jgi:lipooligosaccharide transport system permease protein
MTATTATTAPTARTGPTSRGWLRVLEHLLLLYRRTWRGSIFNSFISPLLFLGAMGVGLGSYVNQSGGGASTAVLGGVTYLAFLAPGLLAAGAMNTAAGEASFPIMAAIEWVRQYRAMLATPISVADIVVGQTLFFVIRLVLVSSIFVAVVVVLGGALSAAVLLAIPAAVLTGLAFATPIAALSATLRNGDKFNLIFRFGITPMFLFSGTFFPIEQLPALVRPIAWLTPLYHGVELTRGLALGSIDGLGVIVHAGYLLVLAVGGVVLFVRQLGRRIAQ